MSHDMFSAANIDKELEIGHWKNRLENELKEQMSKCKCKKNNDICNLTMEHCLIENCPFIYWKSYNKNY